MKSKIALIGLAVGLMAVMVSCGGSSSNKATGTPTVAATPAPSNTV
jgi:hypothetical protein